MASKRATRARVGGEKARTERFEVAQGRSDGRARATRSVAVGAWARLHGSGAGVERAARMGRPSSEAGARGVDGAGRAESATGH
jgi:hypothetical protein